MSRSGRWSTQATLGLILVVLGLTAVAAVLALAIPKGAPLHPGGSSGPTSQVSSLSLGERIFQTGTDENGRPIPRSGVTGMMGSVAACASCHGSDARGRTIQGMMGQLQAPDIRWSTLGAPPTSPGDRAFDPDSFFLAVTQGLSALISGKNVTVLYLDEADAGTLAKQMAGGSGVVSLTESLMHLLQKPEARQVTAVSVVSSPLLQYQVDSNQLRALLGSTLANQIVINILYLIPVVNFEGDVEGSVEAYVIGKIQA